eukprot:109828-Rhodomonas_salina.4
MEGQTRESRLSVGVLGMLNSESGQVGIVAATGGFPLSKFGLFCAPECDAVEVEGDTAEFEEEAA